MKYDYIRILQSHYPVLIDWLMVYDPRFTYREDLVKHSEAGYILNNVNYIIDTRDLKLKHLFLTFFRYSRIYLDRLLNKEFKTENKVIYDFNIKSMCLWIIYYYFP